MATKGKGQQRTVEAEKQKPTVGQAGDRPETWKRACTQLIVHIRVW